MPPGAGSWEPAHSSPDAPKDGLNPGALEPSSVSGMQRTELCLGSEGFQFRRHIQVEPKEHPGQGKEGLRKTKSRKVVHVAQGAL